MSIRAGCMCCRVKWPLAPPGLPIDSSFSTLVYVTEGNLFRSVIIAISHALPLQRISESAIATLPLLPLKLQNCNCRSTPPPNSPQIPNFTVYFFPFALPSLFAGRAARMRRMKERNMNGNINSHPFSRELLCSTMAIAYHARAIFRVIHMTWAAILQPNREMCWWQNFYKEVQKNKTIFEGIYK